MNLALFSSAAPAADAAGGAGGLGNYAFLIVTVLMVAVLYFVMYRPNKKKEKAAAERRNSIEIGDEVTTIGGIVGRVVSMKEDTFVMETAGDRSRMRFRRWAIQDVGKLSLEDGTEGEAIKNDKAKTDSKPSKADK